MSFIFNMCINPHYNLAQLDKMNSFFHHSAYIPLNNYLVFNDVDGLYTYTFEAERKVSSIKVATIVFTIQSLFLYINY
jgi:hypothetical protein